jgi:hypothetical protein
MAHAANAVLSFAALLALVLSLPASESRSLSHHED